MTVTIRLRGGRELTGKTLAAIVRREFGRDAEFWPSHNPESIEAGMIVSPVPYGDQDTYNIHATVLWIETA